MNAITDLTHKEALRQRETLNLIASENYPSPKVLHLLGSVWQNKYAEGAPGKRYYAGNTLVDELETLVQQKALQVFDPTSEYGVSVQVLSGSPANATVFLTALNPGDTVMSLQLANGGHLSHLHATSNYLKFFNLVNYDVTETTPNTYEIDQDDFRAKLDQHHPKLVIIGFSAYPRAYQFEPLIAAAHDAGALVLADVAHINGLIAAGLHDTPFKPGTAGADYVTMTTHKTLRGPRGALLFAKQDLMPAINKTIFPGTSGGPHIHQIAATGQALLEVLDEDRYPDERPFKDYAQAVTGTMRALEEGCSQAGLQIISPTQTHLSLIKLPDDADSLQVQQHLEALGIITNRNLIPFDTKSAWRPSGLRLGTAALTSRGLTPERARHLGQLIADIILGRASDTHARAQVQELAMELAWHYPEAA